MKNFATYLTESEEAKKYEFKIKLAVDVTDEVLDALENAFRAVDLKKLGKAKRLPIQDHGEFPTLGPVNVSVMDLVVGQPATTEQLIALACERALIPRSHIVLRTIAEEAIFQLAPVQKKAITGKDYSKTEVTAAKDDNQQSDTFTFLKDLQQASVKHEFAAPNKEKAKTTNDLPTNDKSPVGSTQNKLPTAKGMK